MTQRLKIDLQLKEKTKVMTGTKGVGHNTRCHHDFQSPIGHSHFRSSVQHKSGHATNPIALSFGWCITPDSASAYSASQHVLAVFRES